MRPRLLSTRNLETHYRVDDTLRAFALIRNRLSAATLTVAGYGSEELASAATSRLPRTATAFASSAVSSPLRSPSFYDDADVFVNSSVIDNQPLSVLEAFASGLPVVSTTPGDLAHLVRDRETGCTVPARNPEAMAGAVISLLEDSGQARLLAGRARREVEEYTWQRVRDKWAAAYRGEPE